MNTQEFIKNLNQVQNLLSQEKYQDAITLLATLKKKEKDGDFDYNLTHKLYQLDSNAKSLMNQHILSEILNNLSKIRF